MLFLDGQGGDPEKILEEKPGYVRSPETLLMLADAASVLSSPRRVLAAPQVPGFRVQEGHTGQTSFVFYVQTSLLCILKYKPSTSHYGLGEDPNGTIGLVNRARGCVCGSQAQEAGLNPP